MEPVSIIPFFLLGAKALLVFVSVLFLVSGLDDLFVDLCYAALCVYRKLSGRETHPAISLEKIHNKPQQRIAFMVPAWDESAVIRSMLEHTLSILDYSNYHVFVGTYPNDEKTGAEVERVRQRFARVERVVLPHDGPTNKADCLNWIYHGIKAYEISHGVQFDIFVMQDCEDVINPLCPKLINYVLPEKDMAQLPVMSLLPKWWDFTAGHYIDEFAQLHYKDIIVREFLNKSIPAAGVGCAFSRRALDLVQRNCNGQLFSIDSLTEDYDFGLRLKSYGIEGTFIKFMVDRVEEEKTFFGRVIRQRKVRELVCIKENFPGNFRASYRQKSRWVLGITLQGWEHLGWLSGLGTRYMLYRDRKALLTNFINILGYFVVLIVIGAWGIEKLDPLSYSYPPLVERGSWVWFVIIINTLLLALRIFMRGYCVQRLYGWWQAVLSLPRMLWGNVINFFATWRAISLYGRYLRTGKIIAWDKTQHSYPSVGELQATRRRLGEMLLERGLINVQQLKEALNRQQAMPKLLGEILMDMHVIRERDLELVLVNYSGSMESRKVEIGEMN